MDLRQQYIKRDRQIAKEYAQITFDDDYIVKDNKPDILKVICTSGNVFVEEIKTINEAVWVSGKVNFYIIYRSDMGSMPERIDGMIPFQEKIFVDNLSELDSVKVSGKIDDIMVSIINSRKVSVKGIISFEVVAEDIEEFPVTCGMQDDDEYQQKGSLEISKRAVKGQHAGQAEGSQTGSPTLYKEKKNIRTSFFISALRFWA